jgi:hypothetical protein
MPTKNGPGDRPRRAIPCLHPRDPDQHTPANWRVKSGSHSTLRWRAGGRWIRTFGIAAQKPWISLAFRALRGIGGDLKPSRRGPAQLTEPLRRAGALPGEASVRAITVESARSTILSRIFRLHLAYDARAPDAPKTIILKTLIG